MTTKTKFLMLTTFMTVFSLGLTPNRVNAPLINGSDIYVGGYGPTGIRFLFRMWDKSVHFVYMTPNANVTQRQLLYPISVRSIQPGLSDLE